MFLPPLPSRAPRSLQQASDGRDEFTLQLVDSHFNVPAPLFISVVWNPSVGFHPDTSTDCCCFTAFPGAQTFLTGLILPYCFILNPEAFQVSPAVRTQQLKCWIYFARLSCLIRDPLKNNLHYEFKNHFLSQKLWQVWIRTKVSLLELRQVKALQASRILNTDGVWPVWASLVLKKEILAEQ